LLGLACGDALGAPAEFKAQAEVQARWGTLSEMVGGGCWAPGEWTDDTGMALCLADGILADPHDPLPEVGQRFLEWRQTTKDVGSTCSASLSAFRGNWAHAARSAAAARQGRVDSNGSLMRTLPVALAYGNRDTMLLMSARLSGMTHWSPQAEVCCALYGLWVHHLLLGKPMCEAWQKALEEVRSLTGASAPTTATGMEDTPGMQPLPEGFWERLESIEDKSYEQLQPSGYAGYVLECLEAAAWCCLKSSSLEEALVQAVNLGGEADTIAAVAGGIAGACWGREAIPERWLAALHRREDLETVAQRLGLLRRHQEVYASGVVKAFNCNWVTDHILAGRHPLTARDVEFLQSQGITHILDLREPHEWAPPRFGLEALDEIEGSGLQRRLLTVMDMGAPTPPHLETACAHIKQVLADPQARLYVHCRAGMERTAAVLVAYQARQKTLSYDEALADLRVGRPLFAPLPNQERAVRQWLVAGS
jgi:ADP-ribosyl-[dinitrogen reductase] hydrolase